MYEGFRSLCNHTTKTNRALYALLQNPQGHGLELLQKTQKCYKKHKNVSKNASVQYALKPTPVLTLYKNVSK